METFMASNPTSLALLSLLITLFLHLSSSYQEIAMNKLQRIERLELTLVVGPESIVFDHLGQGPYTGVSGGQILKWHGQNISWKQFAINSKYRNQKCDGSDGITMESMCGRPLGLQFHKASGILYIADAYYGLLHVGPNGGPATHLANSADGGPFHFTNGVDVDQETGMVYFTDSSTQYRRPDYLLAVLNGDSTGRLMQYDPKTKKVTVLKHGLPFPNGVALGDDKAFLLFAETGNCRITKYWLRGPKAGTMEVFADLPGYPDNIKRNSRGEFWVGINREKLKLNAASDDSSQHAVALRLSREGRVLEVLNGGEMDSVSEVVEKNGTIWIGSVDVPYVGVYRLQV